MSTTRKQYSAKFKARVAIEAIRGEKTLNQLGSHYGVHPVQVAQWRRAALEQLEEIFVDGRRRKGGGEEVEKEALYQEIGRLKVELDWVKKKLACSDEDRREWVEPEHARLSLRRQCELLGINRAIRLSNLSEACHTYTAKGDMKKVAELEVEIDETAAKLWGIKEDELKAIQEAVLESGRGRGRGRGRGKRKAAEDDDEE